MSVMVDQNDDLSISQQCELLGISHSTYYYKPLGPDDEQLKLMDAIDEIYLEQPYYGSRRITKALRRQGWSVGRKRVRRLMRLMGA